MMREKQIFGSIVQGVGWQKHKMAGGRGHGRGLLAVGRSHLAAPLSQLRRIYVFLFELRGFSAGFFWRATYIYDYYILPSRQNLYLFIWYLSGEKTHGALQQNNQIQQILSLAFFCSLQKILLCYISKEARTQSLRCCTFNWISIFFFFKKMSSIHFSSLQNHFHLKEYFCEASPSINCL
jgi:hypothetical protein